MALILSSFSWKSDYVLTMRKEITANYKLLKADKYFKNPITIFLLMISFSFFQKTLFKISVIGES